MKSIKCSLLFTAVSLSTAFADLSVRSFYATPPPPPTYEQIVAAKAQERAVMRTWYVPPHPWRIVDGEINYVSAKNTNWVQFIGKIVEVHKTGVRIVGDFGVPFETDARNNREFFVLHFPQLSAPDEGLSTNFFAKPAGVYSYNAVSGGTRTLRQLDYGIPCGPPKASPVETLIAEERAVKAKVEANAKALKFQQESADKGEAYGLYKMGIRYSTGDGVEKDMSKARELLAQAAYKGNKDAVDALAKLPEK